MASKIIEYLSGLSGIVFDESVLKRIALDRGVDRIEYPESLSQKQKDLLLADLLWTAYISPVTIPSFSRQHGQFSMSKGQQNISNKDALYREAMRLYHKWGERLDEDVSSGLKWSE